MEALRVGLLRRWLERKLQQGLEEACAEELWATYEALLPECRSMLVEPAAHEAPRPETCEVSHRDYGPCP